MIAAIHVQLQRSGSHITLILFFWYTHQSLYGLYICLKEIYVGLAGQAKWDDLGSEVEWYTGSRHSRFLDQLHVFVVPSYRCFRCVDVRCGSSHCVWSGAGMETGTDSPLSFPEKSSCRCCGDVFEGQLLIWQFIEDHQEHIRGKASWAVFSLVIKVHCAQDLARSWTHSMDRQSSLHEDIFEICKWIWIFLFFRFGKGICSHVSSQGVQDPFQMFFVNSLMHHALLCFVFLPLVQAFSCISSHGNLGIFRSLLRCAKNSWRKTIFARWKVCQIHCP